MATLGAVRAQTADPAVLAASGVAVSAAAGASAASATAASRQRTFIRIPRVIGRLQAPDLGLVINTADPYSVEVGEYYRRARNLPDAHILRIDLPVQARLTPVDLERLRQKIDERFDGEVQALALAWTQPYAVECQSITSAVTLGFDPQVCNQPCGRRATSPYFNSATATPFKELRLRPSMLLASSDVERARQMIDRGVASDHTLGLRGASPVQAHFMTTTDGLRSVRSPLFPPAMLQRRIGLETILGEGDLPRDTSRVVLVQTGVAHFQGANAIDWVPGALADHLTSVGGQLDRLGGQSTVLDWLDAGVTASYGTVSEPCNHLQKFPIRKFCCCITCKVAPRWKPTGRVWRGRSRACSWGSLWRRHSRASERESIKKETVVPHDPRSHRCNMEHAPRAAVRHFDNSHACALSETDALCFAAGATVIGLTL